VRWRGVLAVALAVVAVNWIAGNPTRLVDSGLFGTAGGGPIPAEVAFTLSFLLLGVIPALTSKHLLSRSPRELGLGLGDYKAGLFLLAVGVPVAIVAAYIGAGSPAIATEYSLGNGLSRSLPVFLSVRVNLLQSVIATAAHIGKPPVELISAFPASLAFGWVALRTKSIWYALLLHWIVGAVMDWLLLGAQGAN